jgi:hypothetical protein
MFCSFCGTQMDDAATFCSACGKGRSGSATSDKGRIAGHLQLLGILWLALSAFRLLPGVFLILLSAAGWGFLPSEMPGFVPGLLFLVGGVLSLTGVAGIAAGWGLLVRAPWARILAIVVGCLGLLDLPFGTALGVYTLWVLLPEESRTDYERMTTPGAPLAGQTTEARSG